jgi:pimeloyl-ACP methyl ester carboxylesterase
MAIIEHTRTAGGKPPFVFVHGFGCARSDWDAQVAHLTPRHETIAVDLGGHGTTPGTVEHASIETHGRDVAALLDSLKLSPAVLVGHSMGCRVVIEAAVAAPWAVAGIVLVDGSRLGAAGSKAHEATAAQIKSVGYEAFVRPLFVAMFSPSYDPAKSEPIVARALARPPEIAGALFPDIGRWDAEKMDAALDRIHVPLMLIQSTYQDEKRQRRSLEAGQTSPYLDMVKSRAPRAQIEVVPDVGHFPQLERPDAVNALLDRFAAGLKS